MSNVISLSAHRNRRNRLLSDTACAEVARTVSIRQSATETGQQFVARIVRSYLLAEQESGR